MGVAVVLGTTGCSSDAGSASKAGHSSHRQQPVVPAGCIHATGHASVSQGHLTIGPFVGDALAITSTHQEKVWVGTRRSGVHSRAEITVTGPDGTVRHYTREPTSAAGFQAFYPGLVAVTEPGTWVVNAQVGPDRMCARAEYR